jgi:hypothetical protein
MGIYIPWDAPSSLAKAPIGSIAKHMRKINARLKNRFPAFIGFPPILFWGHTPP